MYACLCAFSGVFRILEMRTHVLISSNFFFRLVCFTSFNKITTATRARTQTNLVQRGFKNHKYEDSTSITYMKQMYTQNNTLAATLTPLTRPTREHAH